jgi:hypothetical protein
MFFFCPKSVKCFPVFQLVIGIIHFIKLITLNCHSSGLYYKRVTIVIDAPSVIKVTLQIVVSLTIVNDDAN